MGLRTVLLLLLMMMMMQRVAQRSPHATCIKHPININRGFLHPCSFP
jgi:hypothetical protein